MTTALAPRAHPEMSSNGRFRDRLNRLVIFSAVALGLIAILALTKTEAGWAALLLLFAGWALMPALLYQGRSQPRLRYLLTLPAVLVTSGLLMVTIGFTGPANALLGWWLITAGVGVGGGLGAWFWYRWMPVPDRLDDPFSPGRWLLISIHVGLIVTGLVLVLIT
jgi:hypothetical protein